MKYNCRITGQVIGIIRVQSNQSQEMLAKRANIARSHLAMIENGTKSATVETLWKIASALGMRLSELIRMIEDQHIDNDKNTFR